MKISKEDLRKMIESVFRAGMLKGYGVDHENIRTEEYTEQNAS